MIVPGPAHTPMPEDVDARNKSGHDGGRAATAVRVGHASAFSGARTAPVRTGL